MFKNIYYDTKKNAIHLWTQIKGENFYEYVEWIPYVFVHNEMGNIKDIYGNRVIKKEFKNFFDYIKFQKENQCLENKVRPEIQYLVERFYEIPDEEMEPPKLKIGSLDIEVTAPEFPDPDFAQYPITIITIFDNISKKGYSFGTKKYNGNLDNFEFKYCINEEELLEKFLWWFEKQDFDVLTGWNVIDFDIRYIINRCKVLFGERSKDFYNLLSPVRNVYTKGTGYNFKCNIGGLSVIDYLDIYKRYSRNNLTSYKLDYVSKFELEKGKIDYSEYQNLNELYEQDWNKYVEYNFIDCKRVYELEEKLGYIQDLILTLCLLTRTPLECYSSQTQLIEGNMLKFYRRNGLCAPRFFEGKKQETYKAAYVHPPQKGLHKWVSSIDIQSSYPTHMILLNMSIEKYIGRILLDENQIIQSCLDNNFEKFEMKKWNHDKGINDEIEEFNNDKLNLFNKLLKRNLIAISPCGSVFKQDSIGVMAQVQREMFESRVEVKKKMKETKDENERNKLNNLQNALKILLNSFFGVLSVPYTRYNNVNIAEAITYCGKTTLLRSMNVVNKYINNKINKDENFVLYCDTDSVYFELNQLIKNENDDEIIKEIQQITNEIKEEVNKDAYENTQKRIYRSKVEDFKINFEPEKICKTALFVSKKRYAYWLVDDEGKRKDKIGVMGLEIIRSDNPDSTKEMIEEILNMIMRIYSDKEIEEKINEFRQELKNKRPEEIAANVGVSDIEKYIDNNNNFKDVKNKSGGNSGIPWHVKGVGNHNKLLKLLNIKNTEPLISGDKVKSVRLNKNKFGFEILSFKRWMNEFDENGLSIDYDDMIERYFLNKIRMLLEPIGKEKLMKEQSGFDILFEYVIR